MIELHVGLPWVKAKVCLIQFFGFVWYILQIKNELYLGTRGKKNKKQNK